MLKRFCRFFKNATGWKDRVFLIPSLLIVIVTVWEIKNGAEKMDELNPFVPLRLSRQRARAAAFFI
jgi:hypothetical protein